VHAPLLAPGRPSPRRPLPRARFLSRRRAVGYPDESLSGSGALDSAPDARHGCGRRAAFAGSVRQPRALSGAALPRCRESSSTARGRSDCR
jgi:hypothetical protein